MKTWTEPHSLRAHQVVSIKPNSPASDSGRIKVGDALLSVDGFPVTRVPFKTVAAKLMGPNGSVASLGMERGGGMVRYNVGLTRRFIGPPDAPPREAAAPPPRVSPRVVSSIAPVRTSPRPVETWGSTWASAAQPRAHTPPRSEVMIRGAAHNHGNAGPQPAPPRSPRLQKMPTVLSVAPPFAARQQLASQRSPRPSMMMAAPSFGFTPRAAVASNMPWEDTAGAWGSGTIYQTLFAPGMGSAMTNTGNQPAFQTGKW